MLVNIPLPLTFLAFLIIIIVLTISYHSCWSLKIDGAVTKISFSINFEKLNFQFLSKNDISSSFNAIWPEF